jgi:O-acetylserine/cysteine efflux transporter
VSRIEWSAALLVPLLWGVQFVAIKLGLSAFPPLFMAAMRFSLITLLLLPFVGAGSAKEIRGAAVISVSFGGLGFGLFFCGLKFGSAGMSSVIVQLMPVFTVLLGWPMLGERPAFLLLVGVILAFLGVAVALARPGDPVSWIGSMLIAASALSQGLGNVLIKRLGPFKPIRLVAWMALFTAPQLVLTSAFLETGQLASLLTADFAAWLAFAYTVLVGGALSLGLWFWLIDRQSVARVAPFALLQAVVAIVAGAAFLDERMSALSIIGTAICLGGVALTQIRTGFHQTKTK